MPVGKAKEREKSARKKIKRKFEEIRNEKKEKMERKKKMKRKKKYKYVYIKFYFV